MPASRPDAGGIRRGRLLPHRGCSEARRCNRRCEGPGVRRPPGRGLQADERDVGPRRAGAHAPDRRRQPAHPGCRDHRSRPRGGGRAAVPDGSRSPAVHR